MACLGLAKVFNRLNVHTSQKNIIRNVGLSNILSFKSSPCLMAEPLKKKKKVDPAVVKAREDRKKKKIEKQIRRLEKNARQLKPIEECEVSLGILDEKKIRMRSIPAFSNETLENRALLEKQWARYRTNQYLTDVQILDSVVFLQRKALDELQKESEELYQEAIQIDNQLVPFKREGPLETPCNRHHDFPDGDYLDISKKWE